MRLSRFRYGRLLDCVEGVGDARIRASKGICSPARRPGNRFRRNSRVVPHSGQDVVQLLQVLEDRHADLDVRLDLAELLGRQRAGLLEDVIVDADLATSCSRPATYRSLRFAAACPAPRRGGLRSAPPARSAPRCTGLWRRSPPSRPDDPEEELLEIGVDPGIGELGLDQRATYCSRSTSVGQRGRSSSGLTASSQPSDPAATEA